MRAEIIAIGDELTSGQRLDTNSQWLSARLGELGVPVAFHTTVGDDLEANVAVFRTAMNRAELVISTGGLGPTADDLTREAIAVSAGVELEQDDAALAHIKNLFAQRGRAMPEQNTVQAQFPKGSHVVANPHGTAPGIDLTVPRPCCPPCRVIALPGVPAELFAMWQATVAPAIAASMPARRVIRHRRVKVFGAGESEVEAMLPDMIRRKREPLVGITVSDATITLRITASGPNETACLREMEPTVAQIYDILGTLVFGEEDDELEQAVVRLLKESGRSVAVAEWMTDGLASEWLAHASAGDSCFRGGVVVRDAAGLAALLDVQTRDGASAETAKAMAAGVRTKLNTDYGLAIAAFPPTGTKLQVGVATADGAIAHGFPVATHPAIVKPRAAKGALNLLRLTMLREVSKHPG